MAAPEDDPDHTAPGWSGAARLLVAAAVLVVALGVVAVVATLSHPARLGVAFSGRAPTVTEGHRPGGVGRAEVAAEETLTAPRGDRRSADFELADGLTSFTLRAADLGVAAGQLVSSPGWDRSRDRLYLDLAAGANTVSVAAG